MEARKPNKSLKQRKNEVRKGSEEKKQHRKVDEI